MDRHGLVPLYLSSKSYVLKPHIYIFSGLGADERVFQKLDFGDNDITYVSWETPAPDMAIETYVSRLLWQITSPQPIFIGLSFGGMIAVEMAKQIRTSKVILIASATIKNEIPFYYRSAGKLGLHKLLPTSLLKHSNFITNWLFGARLAEDRALLKDILKDTDTIFLKWAINKIVTWKNQTIPANKVHIHGDKDKLLPIKYVTYDYKVNNGGHLMTLDKAAEISRLLKTITSQLANNPNE